MKRPFLTAYYWSAFLLSLILVVAPLPLVHVMAMGPVWTVLSWAGLATSVPTVVGLWRSPFKPKLARLIGACLLLFALTGLPAMLDEQNLPWWLGCLLGVGSAVCAGDDLWPKGPACPAVNSTHRTAPAPGERGPLNPGGGAFSLPRGRGGLQVSRLRACLRIDARVS